MLNDINISIIIPIYNAVKTLHRTLDGLLEQQFTDFELLLIDDGSSDGSATICKEYEKKDNRVKYFYKTNGGASSARNYGILKSSKNYMCFIDADDYQEKDFLSLYVQSLREYDYDIIFCNMITHSPDGSIAKRPSADIVIKSKNELPDFIINLKQQVRFGWAWNKIFKSSIIKENKLQYREDFNFREDELFCLNYCSFVSSAKYLSSSLYHYQIYPNSLMRQMKDPLEYIRISEILHDTVQNLLPYPNLIKFENEYFLKNLYYSLLLCYFYRNGEKDVRLSVLQKFLSYYKSHLEIKLKYKNYISGLFYKILFLSLPIRFTDFILRIYFSKKTCFTQ